MDTWEPYRKAVRAHVPEADGRIVFDRFHVMRHVLGALDQVRRKEQRALKHVGDRRLTGTKFLWLTSVAGKFTRAQHRAFAKLTTSTLHSARAWALRE